jgi:hypothetical protein
MGRLTMVGAIALVALATCAAALAARGDPKEALTKADQARAKAMLLRKSDLATGFTSSPSGKSPDFYCKAIDESDLTVTGKADSPDFTLQSAAKFFFVSSSANIYRTAAQAVSSWRRNTSPAGETCAKQVLGDSFKGSKVTLRSLSRMSFPKLAPLTISYRVTAGISASGNTVPLYFDLVVLEQGRAQVSLVVGSAGAPLARSELVQFARLTAGRIADAMKGA